MNQFCLFCHSENIHETAKSSQIFTKPRMNTEFMKQLQDARNS